MTSLHIILTIHGKINVYSYRLCPLVVPFGIAFYFEFIYTQCAFDKHIPCGVFKKMTSGLVALLSQLA